MELIHRIQARANAIFEEVVTDRRHLHAHPELSFEENQTASFVARRLEKLGIPYETGVAKTGVVGIIRGYGEGPTIALRADMDALPIQDAKACSYASTVAGVMHACGHDAHTASLLGCAQILQDLRSEIFGTIKLIFQPSEERLPGGAAVMIQEGVLKNPEVRGIIGQHVMPFIPAGKIGIRSGKYMASTDEIYLTIKGRGGHGAQPQMTVDPVAIMASILANLQTVVSRTADPRMPSVLTFGKVIANGATNIIPDEVYLEGTFRTMNEDWRARAHVQIRKIVEGVAEAMGAKADLEIRKGYPVLVNDEALTARCRKAIIDYVGEDNLIDLDLWMAAEDFAWFTQEIPGCFYRLGTRNEAKGIIHGLHTPRFDIEEESLRISTGLMAWLAIQELRTL